MLSGAWEVERLAEVEVVCVGRRRVFGRYFLVDGQRVAQYKDIPYLLWKRRNHHTVYYFLIRSPIAKSFARSAMKMRRGRVWLCHRGDCHVPIVNLV